MSYSGHMPKTARQSFNKVETIIDGTTDPRAIAQAITTYMQGLTDMAFPPSLGKTLGMPQDLVTLKDLFTKRATAISTLTQEIIMQINTRAREINDRKYASLQKKDKSLWQRSETGNVLFGVLVCVDKGISGEAMGVDIANVGRVLAGDIEFDYIPSKNAFYPVASALIKRLIHYGRQGKHVLVEPLIEHTSCGRRGQILANEEAHGDIPTLGYIFDNIEALATEFPADSHMERQLQSIRAFWRTLPRNHAAVVAPDKGLYEGIIQKIAQRQALSQLSRDITIVSPIEVYEKETGNLYAGLDTLPVLTHPVVIASGGFTPAVLETLAAEGSIFSFRAYRDAVFTRIEETSTLRRGSKTFRDLQTNWIDSLTSLVAITERLWDLYTSENQPVVTMVNHFFRAWKRTDVNSADPKDRRVIHHFFHIVAYSFFLDTITYGHEPGTRHIEHYLATGDHEIGSKPLIALGQGDLDRPSASEMFTGYSVLLHSSPGHDGTPIPVVIKMDTDRPGNKPMSTEETNVAFDDLKEFLKLWPYFLTGDMIPVLMVRGKHIGGVSRLGLSIIRSFGDMSVLFEQKKSPLPQFVPANNSLGEVVLVPAKKIIELGIIAGNDLKKLRQSISRLADDHSDSAIQEAYSAAQ